MVSVVVMVTVALVALLLVVRRGGWRTRPAHLPEEGIPRTTPALEAFMQGNAYLAAEQFPEATAAFHRARELDPKRAYVAERLAEAARQQQVATARRPAA